eukprot:jgi/Botrbrau1/6624/Bobra.104_2s0011.1
MVGKLVAERTILFVCDIQERFRSVIHGYPAVIDTARRLIKGAAAFNIPIIVTEQYPKALGSTVAELTDSLPPGTPVFPKKVFSMFVPEVANLLAKHQQIKQVLLVGIETHVCVLQTALDLLEKGYEVHLVVDGVSSSRAWDRAVAVQRIMQAGGLLCTSDMALFQLAKSAEHPQFKVISNLVKEQRPEALPTLSLL